MKVALSPKLIEGQKCVLFDFDGTIADSLGMALGIVNKNARRLGIKPIQPENIPLLRQLGYRKAMKAHKVSWWKLPILVRLVQKEMKRRVGKIQMHEGIPELLGDLNAQGYLLGVVTSNSLATVSEFRARNHLPELHIIASSPAVFGKHRVMRKILRKFGLSTKQVLYVGDEPRDMIAAGRLGIKSIGVLWGFSDSQLLMESGANMVARTPGELKRIIKHTF